MDTTTAPSAATMATRATATAAHAGAAEAGVVGAAITAATSSCLADAAADGQHRSRVLRLGPTSGGLLDPPLHLAVVIGLHDLEDQLVGPRQRARHDPEHLVLARPGGRLAIRRTPLELTDHFGHLVPVAGRNGGGQLAMVTSCVHPAWGRTATLATGVSAGNCTCTCTVLAVSLSVGTRNVISVVPPSTASSACTLTCASATAPPATSATAVVSTTTPSRTSNRDMLFTSSAGQPRRERHVRGMATQGSSGYSEGRTAVSPGDPAGSTRKMPHIPADANCCRMSPYR